FRSYNKPYLLSNQTLFECSKGQRGLSPEGAWHKMAIADTPKKRRKRITRAAPRARILRRSVPSSQIRMSGELHIRQPHASHKDPVTAHLSGSFETSGTHRGDQVVLIHTVAADSYSACELTVLEKGNTAGKDLNSII